MFLLSYARTVKENFLDGSENTSSIYKRSKYSHEIPTQSQSWIASIEVYIIHPTLDTPSTPAPSPVPYLQLTMDLFA